MKYLSLCMPTNGISEWVFPVLDEIYKQDVDHDLFEVVVTDNGNNQDFQNQMEVYATSKDNLIYKKTDAVMFQNQIESLRLASGEYLKFLNHRAVLEPGALQWMIDLVKEYLEEKPVIYLSDKTLLDGKSQEYVNFDEFVRGLRDMASWTTGVGVWKSDFEKIPKDWQYNNISPHSDVLFLDRHRDKYIIDDKYWSHEVDDNFTQKGNYDLYKAFAVEEPSITKGLLEAGDITEETYKYVLKEYENRVVEFYLWFNILHRPCSYDLSGFDKYAGVLMNKKRILLRAYIRRITSISYIQRLKKFFSGK